LGCRLHHVPHLSHFFAAFFTFAHFKLTFVLLVAIEIAGNVFFGFPIPDNPLRKSIAGLLVFRTNELSLDGLQDRCGDHRDDGGIC
jgi:hypothetical protein